MNSLAELKARYAAGKITKADFIRESYAVHDQLFAYCDVLGETDVEEIAIAGDGVRFRIRDAGFSMLAPRNEARVAPLEILNLDRYEPDELAVFDVMAAQATTLLDIGANIGYFALRAAASHPQLRVHAFEPLPTTFSYLARNVAESSLRDRITCYGYGMSDANGSFEFFTAPLNGTNASLRNVADAEGAKKFVGLTITLDDWCANFGILPDLIKCDVEGAELLVFKGAEKTLGESSPMVFTEMLRKWAKAFGYHPNDVIALFARYGYECFGIGEAGLRRLTEVDEETVETNYVFLHPRRHAAVISGLSHA